MRQYVHQIYTDHIVILPVYKVMTVKMDIGHVIVMEIEFVKQTGSVQTVMPRQYHRLWIQNVRITYLMMVVVITEVLVLIRVVAVLQDSLVIYLSCKLLFWDYYASLL